MFELDQELIKELMAENHAVTLLDLKKRSEYPAVTTTSTKINDDLKTPDVIPPVADSAQRLSEIASRIPPVNPDLLTMRYSALLAQLLMEEVGRVTPHDHTVRSMRASNGPTCKFLRGKPSPNNMPVSLKGRMSA